MKTKTNDLAAALKNKPAVTTKELADLYHNENNQAGSASIRKRISRLKIAGQLATIRKGVYAVSKKPVYSPRNDEFTESLINTFQANYPEINACCWSSGWLNSFMIHQPARYFYLFETEPDMVETTFNLFKDSKLNVWLNPDENTMQLYVLGFLDPIIVKPLVSRAPLIKTGTATLPTLEKILVDAWTEKKIFYSIQGEELVNIFDFAFAHYTLSYSRLIGYARRRGIDQEIDRFVRKNVQPENRTFLND
ncbi:MAG: type IV toxin-antitoxin system AbiEi family antitoxin domain-containing protein [Bacteroidales bacterium]